MDREREPGLEQEGGGEGDQAGMGEREEKQCEDAARTT